jgi:hypothetical protein
LRDFLSKQSVEALSDHQVLCGVHYLLGHNIAATSEMMDIGESKVRATLMYLKTENLLDVAIEPVGNVSRDRLSSFVQNAVTQATPTKRRKAVKAKRPTQNNRKGPLDVSVSDWTSSHFLKYFEICWCEQGWKTPPPRWGVKDRANGKRVVETYGAETRKLVDYVFENWKALQAQFNIQGLPSVSILWGFRNSIAPQAFGDVGGTAPKSWGTSHDADSDRNDGDEIGW